jgi:hypothetical protein
MDASHCANNNAVTQNATPDQVRMYENLPFGVHLALPFAGTGEAHPVGLDTLSPRRCARESGSTLKAEAVADEAVSKSDNRI